MRFSTGELTFTATVSDSSSSVSAQTGATLRCLTIQFRAQKPEMHGQALAAALLRRTGGVFSLTEDGEREAEWRIVESGFAYIGSPPWGMNHNTWSIQEVERISCAALLVGALSLVPYEYAEQLLDDALVVVARCCVSDAELDGLRQLDGPVAVARVGISDEPRQMRVDYVWGTSSTHEALAVVVRCEDALEPRMTLSSADVPAERDLLRRLLGAEQRHAARHVTDVDAWPLTTS